MKTDSLRFSLYREEYRSGDYYPEVVAYYFKQWDDFTMPMHDHNAVEIMYVIAGTCVVETEEDRFQMKKGDFITLDANVPHRLLVEHGSCRMLNLEFVFSRKPSVLPPIRELAAENRELHELLSLQMPYFMLRDPNDLYHTLKSLVLELDERKATGDGLMTNLLLAQLLIRIARLAAEAQQSGPKHADFYVKKAIAYMHHHYDCDIQVKDIAAAVNLHPGYLHRIFKINTGTSILDYLTSLRVEKAKMLLAHTDIPVIDISGYIGINSRQYFSAIFKKVTGTTPVEYRRSAGAIHWHASWERGSN